MRTYAKAIEEQLFIKKETVGSEGVLVSPVVTDRVLAVGVASSNQDQERLTDEQIRDMRSRLSPIGCWYNPGEWNFTTYVKPSGVLGTKSETDVLFECVMGRKCVSGSPAACSDWWQGVLYALDSDLTIPSFSLWRKVGTSIFAMQGCTVENLAISISGDNIASLAWSGSFMKQWLAGESKLTLGEAGGVSTVRVLDARRFSDQEVRIEIGDNTPATGYLVTGADYDNNTLSISPVLAGNESKGAVVKGWYPTGGSVDTKKPVCGRMGLVKIDGKDCVVVEATINIVNNIKYYINEKNNEVYATAYGTPGFREITGKLTMYYAPSGSRYFYKAENQMQDALIVPAGANVGNRMRVFCPQIEYNSPDISGDEDVMIELEFDAVGTAAGDDEIRIAFD